MQNRGSPVNRIPIMAKDVLDLFRLYQLVVEKGGLVEVINRKIWRDITKGLNLPASITSAAFTLRTQYMKYLYPYECFKEKLSTYSDLQTAIEGNRRETRGKQLDYQVTTNLPQVYPGLMLPSFLTGLRLPNGLSDSIPHSRTTIPGNRKRKRHDSNKSTSEENTIKVTIEIGSKTYSGSIPLLDTSKN